MAADGNFRIESELERFLHRCPKIQSVSRISNLTNKGENLTEDEVVQALGQLVLHPNYTVPLLGCFRPIAQEILEKTIELLQLVPNLRADNNDHMNDFDEDSFLGETEDSDSTELVNLIDVYVRNGKGLSLHELACLAFSRALDLFPNLLGTILIYFKFAPAPFQRIVQCVSVSDELSMGSNRLLNFVRASYRLLTLEPDVFITLWDWSCFLDLAHESRDLTLINDAELRKNISDIRWCSVGILSLLLRLSFKASAELNINHEESFENLTRWQEFCMDVSLEKGGWYLESSVKETSPIVRKKSKFKEDHSLKRSRRSSLSKPSSIVHEIMAFNEADMADLWNPGNPFYLTSAATKSFEMVSLAVSQRWSILLYGAAGAGKTALVYKLAHSHGSRVLSIHMDEQIDGKGLVGSYVCTEQPGEFRWQPGSLTQAVVNGFWVVFEDVDKAPPEILSILLPLLEGTSTFSTGHGEAVRVHENFRLFSTVTSSNLDVSRLTEGRNLLSAAWRKVMISPPSNDDLEKIVLKWYPELGSLVQKLIETFERVNQIIRFQLGLTASSSYNDRFTLRDLLKLCKRIASLSFSFGQGRLSAATCKCIYNEVIDVFASFSTSAANRLAIMREIAILWTIPAPETLYPVNKPVIKELGSGFQVGRANLQRNEKASTPEKKPFVELRSSVHALERIACSAKFNEPVLLVGETGTGKTTLVQSLATRLGQKLTVLNLSQQSDVADLLGGFKPIDARFVCIPLYNEFQNLFTTTFSSRDNGAFLSQLKKFLDVKNWKMLLNGFQKGVKKIIEIGKSSPSKKRKRPLTEELLTSWENFSVKLERAHSQVTASDGMVFSFVEGAFITSLKSGEWILLDEVNLAPPEILQRFIGVLEGEKGSLCLAERGDIDYIHRHQNFRLFACMNPATDAGKRDLPFSIRSRFTEYFVDDVLDDEDLSLFINQFIDEENRKLTSKIVQFYKIAKQSEEKLQDGANQKPHYSLRSLYRALEYSRKAKEQFGLEKSLYDGFSMFFLNLLDDPSAKLMNGFICRYLLNGKMPPPPPFDSYLPDKTDTRDNQILESYVLTKSVKEQLKNLARAIFVRRYPILLQGPTSSGKTSLVQFLAAITGHEFVRINNHEHTDLQEYLGSYITDASGKLVFHEGVLVKAVRHGHWIVLDELNLAPSDVLEALNRLLDDNRELFVPELNETIRADSNFLLFATQNPPGVYGGRKILSRAFRNRFVEIHVDEIPQDELSTILEKRCKIPLSHANKMVTVMKDLQKHRQSSKIFAGKHGFITPRDLFRWAERFREFGKSYEDLARDGYYLMAERLRDESEKTVVKEVLEKVLRVKLSEDELYKPEEDITLKANQHTEESENIGKIVRTKSMWRMYFLVKRCLDMREPVLLVGETGGGKTTVCQLLSIKLNSQLHVLNCHQYTETSDFLGGFYPVRERSRISTDFQNYYDQLIQSKAFNLFPGDAKISMDINQASPTLHMLGLMIQSYRERSVSHPEVGDDEIVIMENIYLNMIDLHQKWRTIFTWQDGPLVESMKRGDTFLADEISLADDSVLERLNSVLEPERKLSLAEKGGSNLENIIAHRDFFLLATMNPGGDYGKKELSPALRNRFTEIWVPSVNEIDELKSIALQRILNRYLAHIVDVMLSFWEWFNQLQIGRVLTVRDLLSWVSFINVTEKSLGAESALVHGAFLVLLDGLSLGTNLSKSDAAELRLKCFSFLQDKLKDHMQNFDSSNLEGLDCYGWADPGSSSVLDSDYHMDCDDLFGIHPFYIEKGTNYVGAEGFEFMAPTTKKNTFRVLRAMQLSKPVLLEGSPGVGKTSLIVALGKFSGHTVVRINLSEQTDLMDLLGSDLPVESDEGIQFAWSDGILLQALKKGSWVLLDELNLAPQSVLEGLNAILDHRAEVFIPELGRTFKCPTSFRVFACQNPSSQGGGRKGLPKSFLNRFTKVYVDELVEDDYLSICSSLFPSIDRSLLLNLVAFNKRLHEETMLHHKFGQKGSPWEFNLRDVIRSCQIIQGVPENSKPDCFLSTVYLQRMRTPADRIEVIKLYEQIFGLKPFVNPQPRIQLTPHSLTAGDISIERYQYSPGTSQNTLKILPELRHCLESVAQCVKHQWMCILVGPPSSGKTSVIRLLAGLTGNVLHELNLSSATDISELIGCFEQKNASRHYRFAISRVERFVNEYSNLQLENYSPEAFVMKKEIITRWLAFLAKVNNNGRSVTSENPRMRDSVPRLVEIIELLKAECEEEVLPFSWSPKDLDTIMDTLRKLEEDDQKSQYSVKFEWVTGLLIKAIENGEWIVLENANLCNPTVLDRINSLVEQSGSITINECGIVEGKPVVLHPHPKFRMFLTVNPSYGEVSRAMRNRGVEIYLMKPNYMLKEAHAKNLDEIALQDVKRFITLSGITIGKLVDTIAKSHIYAVREGSLLDVNITYLELSQWIQLFQRLVTDGSRPAWSIQISWEHTYLSSFGEFKGRDIVSHVLASFLSIPDLYNFNTSQDLVLCLPGGWPTPLKLQDYAGYSIETCVRKNCMYLESLGSEIGSHELRNTLIKVSNRQNLLSGGLRMVHLMDAKFLHGLVFPKESNYGGQFEFDKGFAQKKLLFAVDWVIEQASLSDRELYVKWFDWFGARLEQSFPFFNRVSGLLKEELEHSIWKRIDHHLKSIQNDFSTSRPMLSMESIDEFPFLNNAIKCVSLLRRSLRQWSTENDPSTHTRKPRDFKAFVSLRRVEEKMLCLLVESPSFDVLFKSYCDLLEHHILFWNSMVPSINMDCLMISWRSLMKDTDKLQEFCPEEVENFQIEMKTLSSVSSSCLNSRKSLLWAHGGHPILPSSAELYNKQCQLSNLCEMVWSRKNKYNVAEIILLDGEHRLLAMLGVCMASYIVKDDDGELNIIRLEEMYQILLGWLDFEKHKLEAKVGTIKLASWTAICSSCCVFTPDVLCRKPGINSWLETQLISDESSLFLDLELLSNLTKISVLDTAEQRHALFNASSVLKSSMNFALNNSSRPPTDFSPHQKILWTVDAWESVKGANEKVSSFILEMWFRWHATLWEACPIISEELGYGILLPHKLFRPLKLLTVNQILEKTDSINEYPLHELKLRVASRNIWQSSGNTIISHDFLLSAAQSLFQQIIYAHKKSFEASEFANIRYAFHSIQAKRNPENMKEKNMEENMKALISSLGSSNHRIFTSLIDSFIKPLLNELYTLCPSNDIEQIIGCAFLRIGGLRYNLLICCDDLDPTVKYSIKYSELTKKIDSLETEIQVREECVYLAGSTPSREADSRRSKSLENLYAERTRLQRKIVFRSDPGKFRKLKHACDDFLKLVDSIKDFTGLLTEQVTERVKNWQETASCFIDQLSNEYSAYVDIIEPVQVAIYEMKLGLSLIFSSVLSRKQLVVKERNIESVMGTIYTFMRFPRGISSKTASVNVDKKHKPSIRKIEYPASVAEVDMDLLEDLVFSTRGPVSDTQASNLQFKIALYRNCLARIKSSVADVGFLDDASFKLLHEIFDNVACYWMDWMDEKHQIKSKDSQQFSFRARAFKIESITTIDESDNGDLLADDTFSEHIHENKMANGERGAMEENWDLAEESNLDDMVNIHNQLFGSDLIRKPGSIEVSDEDRLSSFLGSYTLGVKMIRDLKGSFSSIFDAKIVPEHLLRLCLEDNKLTNANRAYNFYKDSNSATMVKLVVPVEILKERILFLMKEWDDHPALQSVLKIIDIILALPLDTPLAKALSGLQFLISGIRNAQENVAKFPLSDQLKPLFALMSSWYKLEFESWPALLDEVQSQFERNAGKLLFPLYSVLRRGHSDDIEQYNKSTIQSLDDFFRTASIGEFRKQLQIILSLHGQISFELGWKSYANPCQVENLKILYNAFGFYIQFLPLILEHIEKNREGIEKELKDLLKLCRWDRIEDHLAFENMKRTRQKLSKIVQKYTELLQQPVMPFLSPSPISDSYEVSKNLLDTICNQIQTKDKESSLWLANWWESIQDVLQSLHCHRATDINFPDMSVGEVMDEIKRTIPSQSPCFLYREDRKQSWRTIEEICNSLIHCGEIWENKSKNLRKRRAFHDILKFLEDCGLSKHRASVEGRSKLSSWPLQQSYEVQHLLLTQSEESSGNVKVQANKSENSSRETIWKTSNKYYFKSIASVQVLVDTCHNFHKDFSLIQVNRLSSYVDHLLEIQQEQRAVAYNFSKQLKSFRQCISPLSNLFSSGCSFSKNQHASFICMFQQKQILDEFCAMMHEEHLLLQTVGNSHLNACPNVKKRVEKLRLFIQKSLPDFQKSKNLLDHYLLGSNGDMVGDVSHLIFGVTTKREKLVNHNFQLIKTFKKVLSDFRVQENVEGAAENILLGNFNDLIAKADVIGEKFAGYLSENVDVESNHNDESIIKIKSNLDDSLKKTYMNILGAFQRAGLLKYDFDLTEESLKNIKLWKKLFEGYIENLQPELICADVMEIIESAGKLLKYIGNQYPSISSSICTNMKDLYDLCDALLAFGDNLLRDFLDTHSMVSTVTHVLANIFSSLFSKGFGTSEEEDVSLKESTQDASGTGMGEGAGMNDVSDQISDEDQLLGASEKPNEEQDPKSENPGKDEKGIEMEQDFTADALDVSEDSEEDENEDNQEDEQIDSQMGETGDKSEVVDEKLGDMNDDKDDENPTPNEKYENGPPVKETASNDEEFRAKDDSAPADEDDRDLDAKESNENGDQENGDQESGDGPEDMELDKNDAFADPSGVDIDGQDQKPEEATEMEELEDGKSEELNGSDEEKSDLIDESMEEEGEPNEIANDDKKEVLENEIDNETDIKMPKEDPTEASRNSAPDNTPEAQSLGQPKEDSDTADLGEFAQDETFSTDLSGFPNASESEVRVADSADGRTLSHEQKSQPSSGPNHEPKAQPNPCRSLGDALKGWKERVKVSFDFPDQIENTEDFRDDEENVDEYAYTAEFKDGTEQALGPATADQINGDVTQNEVEMDDNNKENTEENLDADLEMIDKQTPKVGPTLNSLNDVKKRQERLDFGKNLEEPVEEEMIQDQDLTGDSESLVSIKRSDLNEDYRKLSELTLRDDDLGKACSFEVNTESRDDAAVVWRKYESVTTRLSQELVEQLRLVMEPTLASRLQGDYKTGKRINMKKVIPYVASHYRKDKIWLRRTRPSKRDYQVVIAVDDSRSMSEGRTGNFAIEALVTVCRAMSQLEVGDLAVASFGRQGNIQLLHDFDQMFTPEAGIKMISSLTFKQENTVANTPMAELLKYLNNMMDTAVMHARLPSGVNPLQQLILIIADGRFNEDKEKLKRYVRDILSKKRMVAFLILDSPNESIMEILESFKDGKITKYIDSFPFPFYIVLKNIEALPRTLADLLRQWFELMQHSRE